MTEQITHLWSQLPEEPPKAYRAFMHYCEQDSEERTVVATYRALYKKDAKNARVPAFMSTWVKRFRWKLRAEAYDRHFFGVRNDAKERVIAEETEKWARRREVIREEAWDRAIELLKKADEMLAFPLSEIIHDDKTGILIQAPAKWTVRDIPLLIKTAEELRRVAASMATKITPVDVKTAITQHIEDLQARGVKVEGLDADAIATLAEQLANAVKQGNA